MSEKAKSKIQILRGLFEAAQDWAASCEDPNDVLDPGVDAPELLTTEERRLYEATTAAIKVGVFSSVADQQRQFDEEQADRLTADDYRGPAVALDPPDLALGEGLLREMIRYSEMRSSRWCEHNDVIKFRAMTQANRQKLLLWLLQPQLPFLHWRLIAVGVLLSVLPLYEHLKALHGTPTEPGVLSRYLECRNCGGFPARNGLLTAEHKPGDICPASYLDDYDCDGVLVLDYGALLADLRALLSPEQVGRGLEPWEIAGHGLVRELEALLAQDPR